MSKKGNQNVQFNKKKLYIPDIGIDIGMRIKGLTLIYAYPQEIKN